MMRFGPSGNGETFYNEGNKHSWQMPSWLASKGLNAYEYSFGRGVRIKPETAILIREEARRNDIKVSIHAPFYINMASVDVDRQEKSIGFVIETLVAAKHMGSDRIIVHTGACTGMDREVALQNTKDLMARTIKIADESGYEDIIICPEVMGKMNQQGTLDEIVDICSIDDRLLPCVDFGHVNARGQGSLKEKSDYEVIFDTIENKLGNERMRKFHIHFSRIQFTVGGEKMHWNYEDIKYGPNFEPLAELLYERNMDTTVICESKDFMTEDSLIFKGLYELSRRVDI